MTYTRPGHFIAGRVFLILWILSAVMFISLAVTLASVNNQAWMMVETLLTAWAITNIVKYVRELQYNNNLRKEATK